MQAFNIVTKREYEINGETKASWKNVGRIKIMPDGKMFIDLFMFPDTKFYTFPIDNERTESDLKPMEEINVDVLNM